MIARILAFLFPPKLPGRLQDWPEPAPYRTFADEQGWAGKAKRRYTGIEKHYMLGELQRRALTGPPKM